MKDIIIFDTNAIKNQGFNEFLGGREILRQLEPDADFYIPKLVIEEIIRQKKREFEKSKQQLFSNQLVKVFRPELSSIEELDIDSFVLTMQSNESFSFEIIPCVQGELIDRFRSMAIVNKAPFNKDSDKGFKDACIYISILNYLPEITGRTVFFWGNDGRLKDAFHEHDEVKVINTIEQYHQESSRFLMDEYFYGVLAEELSQAIDSSNILGSWRNKYDNWIVSVSTENQLYLVEVDSREIVSKIENDDIDQKVVTLVESGDFTTTHNAIEDLLPFINFLSKDNVSQINQASEENSQIRWIAEDSDVEEFLNEINK